MANNTIDIDALSRNRIVSDTDKNFFVEAGAGSGKTTMLVNRMVAMVEQGKDIEKICAITFTKAAAGEFYERFQKLLIDRSSDDYVWEDKGYPGQLPKPTEESKERCRNALQNIDLCFMGTIDSFCGMVLSEHPSEAGIPSDATIMSDVDVQVLYKREYVNICEGKYGKELADYAKSFRMLYWNAEDIFVKGMTLVMNHRNAHFNYAEVKAINVDTQYKRERESLIKALECLINHPELMYDGNKDSVSAWEQLPAAYKAIKSRWSNNYSRVLRAIEKISGIRLIKTALDTYGSSLAGEFESGGAKGGWLELTAAKEGGVLEKLTNIQYGLSMSFLIKCVPIVEGAMRDLGAFTYFDYLYYLRNMLKENASKDGKLIKYIYDRHSYFLIDEFQDTNPMQAEVFFYLSAEKPVENWTNCVPRQGSLFIVGDPKQSIYRFRSADVTSFLKVKGLFEQAGGEILTLSRNFRSTKQLCSHFNASFTGMLSEETITQSKYEEIPLPDETINEFQGVYTYTAFTGTLEAEHPEETNPIQIGKIICSIVNNPKYKIKGKDDKEPRMVKFNDFMIITYGKSKLSGIMDRLDELNIPTRVEGKVPFEDNEALKEVLKIYKAAADVSDSLALYGALNSKLIGHSRGDLLNYKLKGGKIRSYSVLDESEMTDAKALAVAGSISKLNELGKKALRLSPAALMSNIIDTFEIYRIVPSDNMEVVYYALELMRNAEKSGLVNNLKDGANYIKTLIEGGSDEERCLSLNDNRDCVHMANLHKVKGLEAPIVILSASTQFRNGVSERFTHDNNSSEGYVFSLDEQGSNGNSYPLFKTSDYTDEREAEKQALNDENKRLVYVAGTRARNSLIICDSISKVGRNEGHKSIWKPLMESGKTDIFSVLDEVKESIDISYTSVDSTELYDTATSNSILNDRAVEDPTFEIKNPSHARIKSKLADDEAEVIAVIEQSVEDNTEATTENKSNVHRFPDLLGTMTHRLMEMIVSTKNALDTKVAIDEIIREYRTPENQPYEAELVKALNKVAETMRNGGYDQVNDVPKDILSELLSSDEVYCETPFCYKDETDDGVQIWNGIMDVIYCKEGKWHIVDYKTNIDGTELDKKYHSQVEAYIKAFKEITGNDADAKTYHIDI